MHRRHLLFTHNTLFSMIIHNLHVVGVVVDPLETYPPLIIDADAVLSLAIAAQLFEPVGRRRQEIVEFHRGVQVAQPAKGSSLDVLRQPARECTLKDLFGLFVSERLDHGLDTIVPYRGNTVKR